MTRINESTRIDKENSESEIPKRKEVWYKGEKIGEYRLDMVVEDKIIPELKVVSKLGFVLFAYSWNSCSRLYLYKRK